MRKLLQRLTLTFLAVTLVFLSTQTYAEANQIIDEVEINTISDENELETVNDDTTPYSDEQIEDLENTEDKDLTETEVEVIEPENNNTQMDVTPEASPFSLNANEVIITSFSELKNYIVNRGNGIYDTYYLGADLNGLVSGIRVPAGYSFTIDGLNPETNIKHTFYEYRSAATADTISHAGKTAVTMTLRNLLIEGQNFYGTIYTSAASENVVVVYDNVTYTGPQITHNIGGTAIYRNSTIKIGEKSYHSASQEVGEVKHVIFEGHVSLDQANGLGPVFTMTASNSFTFANGATVDVTSRRGMSSRTTGTQIIFEENAILNFTQFAAPGTSAAFYLEGAKGYFEMRPGSEFNVKRPFTTNTGESILYSAKLGTAIINGGKITLQHDGGHTSYGLFNLANMTLTNGATIDLNIGKNLSYTPFDVKQLSDLVDSTINVTLGGNYDATAPMIGATSAVQTNTYNITNSKIHVEANTIAMYIVNVGTLNLEGADINIKAHGDMKSNPFRQTNLTGMSHSNFTLDYHSFTPTGPLLMRSKVGDFSLDNSNIIIKGNIIKNPLLDSANLNVTGQSSISIESNEDITTSIINTTSISDLNNFDFSLKAQGNYTPGVPIINTQNVIPFNTDHSSFLIDVHNLSSTLIGSRTNATLSNTRFDITTRGSMNTGIFNAYDDVSFINSSLKLEINQLKNPYITSDTITFENTTVDSTTTDIMMSTGKALFMTQRLDANTQSALTLNNHGAAPSIMNPLGEALTLDTSSLTFTSKTQQAPVVVTKEIILNNSKLDISIDQTQLENNALIETNSLNSTESTLLLSAINGTLDAALAIAKEFHFEQAANSAEKRLLIIAPKAKSILRTQSTPITFTLQAGQMNLWNSYNTGGLTNRPTIRYERDDTHLGELKISYLFPKTNDESLSIITNTFESELWDNPEETLSFKTSIMTMVSAGSFAMNVDEFSLNDTEIKGTTEGDAELHLSYTSNNTSLNVTDNADATGAFSLHTEPISRGDIKLEAAAQYLYAISPISPISDGSLRFGAKENTVTFGNLTIPNKETLIHRTNEMNIEIIDDRTSGSAWKLEIKILGHLSDVNEVRPDLTNALIYKQGSKQTVLVPNVALEIANSQTHTQDVTQLQWGVDEGILLLINEPWKIYTNTEYSAKIQWILSDLK